MKVTLGHTSANQLAKEELWFEYKGKFYFPIEVFMDSLVVYAIIPDTNEGIVDSYRSKFNLSCDTTINTDLRSKVTPAVKAAMALVYENIKKGREESMLKTTSVTHINSYAETTAREMSNKNGGAVNPSHYKGEIEAIDAIRVATKDLKGIQATDTGNVMKYMWRWKKKNGVEDLKKALWYLNHLIGEVEKETK